MDMSHTYPCARQKQRWPPAGVRGVGLPRGLAYKWGSHTKESEGREQATGCHQVPTAPLALRAGVAHSAPRNPG